MPLILTEPKTIAALTCLVTAAFLRAPQFAEHIDECNTNVRHTLSFKGAGGDTRGWSFGNRSMH
jgi:hypothetical protein